jgi:hypothetical protein
MTLIAIIFGAGQHMTKPQQEQWPSPKKKGIRPLDLIPYILVRLAGIEPTTPWFVAKYSIQLSYSREKQNYSKEI